MFWGTWNRGDSAAFSERVRTLYRVLGGMVSSNMTVGELVASRRASSTAGAVPTNIPPVTLAVPRDQVAYYRQAAVAYMQATLNTNVQVLARESLSDPTRAENANIWQQMRQVANRADVIAGPAVAAVVRSGRAEGILLDLTARAPGSRPATISTPTRWNRSPGAAARGPCRTASLLT